MSRRDALLYRLGAALSRLPPSLVPTGSLESWAGSLFQRLLRQPLDPSDLQPELLRLLTGTHPPSTPRVERGRWLYRNVDLPWVPHYRAWRDRANHSEYAELYARGAGLRVLDAGWGMSSLSHPVPRGNLLLAREPRQRTSSELHYDPATRTVRCSAGANFAEVYRLLATHGRALQNQPGFSELGVVGCLAVGGHGSGLSYGPLAELVTAVELLPVDPGASPRVLRIERGHPRFDLAVTHLGRLGPVVAVELATVPAFQLAETRMIQELGRSGRDHRRELRELVDDCRSIQRRSAGRVHSMELWVSPYRVAGVLTVAVGLRRFTTEELLPRLERPGVLRSQAMQALGETMAIVLALGLRRAVPTVLRQTLLATETPRSVVMPSYEALDFGAPNLNDVVSFEAAVPADRGAEAVVAAVDWLEQRASGASPQYVLSPIGVRFVGRGPQGGISPHAGRSETVHIEVPTFRDVRSIQGDDLLPDLQAMLATHFHGRPHWGQQVWLPAEALRSLWPAASFEAMHEWASELDPEGTFASALLDTL